MSVMLTNRQLTVATQEDEFLRDAETEGLSLGGEREPYSMAKWAQQSMLKRQAQASQARIAVKQGWPAGE